MFFLNISKIFSITYKNNRISINYQYLKNNAAIYFTIIIQENDKNYANIIKSHYS